MPAFAAALLPSRFPRPGKGAVLRMAAAGTAWGLALSAGMAGLALWNCGAVCPDDVAMTTLVSVAAGIVTIGPVAAFGRAAT